jgi:hypothetical protein
MDTISQVLTMDIGFGDVVTPSPIDLDYPTLLESLPAVNILAYSLETVIAEKFHHNRNETEQQLNLLSVNT